ncbi:MAG: hypothetical protein WBM53_15035 [Maribacter sp.]
MKRKLFGTAATINAAADFSAGNLSGNGKLILIISLLVMDKKNPFLLWNGFFSYTLSTSNSVQAKE